jgi:hypothetical protein
MISRSVNVTAATITGVGSYSKRELKQASDARELSRLLGYPSDTSLANTLSAGGLLNCPITVKDVQRAHELLPHIGSLRGKTTTHKSMAYKESESTLTVERELTMSVDIMFVNRRAFLISLTKPLGYTLVHDLGTNVGARSKSSIRRALNEQIASYKAQRFQIKTLLTDGEGAIASLKSELNANGIVVNPSGPGQHVPDIERKIREVKERMRTVLHSLPFTLPQSLLAWLVYYAVRQINIVIHSGGPSGVSPREAFLGVKTDFTRDCRVGFGDYLEATNPHTHDNSMAARTQACIALLPIGIQGTIRCLSLDTGKIINRDQFKVLPPPDTVISYMNKLSSADNISNSELNFSMHNFTFYDNDEEEIYQPIQSLATNNSEPILVLRADDTTQDTDIILVEQRAEIDDAQVEEVQSYLVQEPESITNTMIEADYPQITQDTIVPMSLQLTLEEESGPTATDTTPPEPTSQVVIPIVEGIQTRSRSHRGERVHWDPKTGGQAQALLTTIKQPLYRSVYRTSLNKALKDPARATAAAEARDKELRGMIHKQVFVPLHTHQMQGMQPPIPTHMFMKDKFKADGSFDKYKARLVGGGNFQNRSESLLDDVSSPTAALPFVLSVAAIAAYEGRSVVTADIPSAYLNADNSALKIAIILDPEIARALCVIKPSYVPFIRNNGTIVCKLLKGLYGCIESGRLWFNLITSVLVKDGFTANPVEPCIFNKTSNGFQCTVVLYVDDLMITSKDPPTINALLQLLGKQFGDKPTVTEGSVHSYLGMSFDFSTTGIVSITMEGYVKELVSSTGVQGTAATPAASYLFTVRDTVQRLNKQQTELFHSTVMRILYLAKRVRGDILLATSFLSTRVLSPDMDDQKKLNRLLQYINGTQELGIKLSYSPESHIQAYIDASYGVHSDFKSHSGMVISIGVGPVDLRSTKQKLTTKSSTESELVSLSDMCGRVIWQRDFLIGQGMLPRAAKVLQDNQSAMALIKRGSSNSERTRHVAIRYYWVKDRVDSGELEVVYCPTEDMIADILTKPLQGELFIKLRQLLLNWY